MSYAQGTQLRMTEHAYWHSLRPPPTVVATVASVKQTSVGVLYSLDFTSSKTANGKPVYVTRFLFEGQLKQRVTEVIAAVEIVKKKRTRKSVPKTVKRGGNLRKTG